MNPALLNLSPFSMKNISSANKNIVAGDTGKSLFQNLLSKINGSSGESSWGETLFQKQGSLKKLFADGAEDTLPGISQSLFLKNLFTKNTGDTLSDPSLAFVNKLRELASKSSHLVLPDSAVPQLTAFLQSQGYSAEKINQILLSAKDEDGCIQLDKLLGRIAPNESENTTANGSPVIQTSDIPRVQEILFRLGLGAGEVKEVIEKSVNQEGKISTSELSNELKQYISGISSDSDLLSLLENNNIEVKTPILDEKNMAAELKNQFMKLQENNIQDVQKTIKTNIATILREKGIPPQEVKSFIENLNIEVSRSALNNSSSRQSDINNILNQVSLKNETPLQEGTWNEKILGILKKDRLLISNDSGKDLSSNKSGFKLNVIELMKQSTPKTKSEPFASVSEARVASKQQDPGAFSENGNRMSQTGNSAGNEFSIHNIGKTLGETVSVIQNKEGQALPHPLPKILDQMNWMIRSGEQRGKIMINPPELGRLDLDIALKNGHLHAHLSAETLVVKEMIETNLNQLKQQLTDQGFTVDKFEVMVGLDNKGSQKGNTGEGHDNRYTSSSKKGGRAVKNVNQEVDKVHPDSLLIKKYQVDVHV